MSDRFITEERSRRRYAAVRWDGCSYLVAEDYAGAMGTGDCSIYKRSRDVMGGHYWASMTLDDRREQRLRLLEIFLLREDAVGGRGWLPTIDSEEGVEAGQAGEDVAE